MVVKHWYRLSQKWSHKYTRPLYFSIWPKDKNEEKLFDPMKNRDECKKKS